MSLVDITPLPAEDEIMDPATKQYVDSGDALAEARNDVKLAEFRVTVEGYMARAEERDAAARERAEERDAAARELADKRDAAVRERADEREAAARERALRMEKTIERIEAGMISLKRTVITTAIAATLSTIFGVAAFNAALMQNIFAAIELGQKTSPSQAKMQADIEEIKRQLAELRAARDR